MVKKSSSIKYAAYSLKGGQNYVVFYILGDVMVSLVSVIPFVLQEGLKSFFAYFLKSLVPPSEPGSFILTLVIYPIVGAGISALSWYISVPKR